MSVTAKKLTWSDWAKDPGTWNGTVEGADLGGQLTILFYTTEEVGAGPGLHVHEYDEVFVVRQGRALFTVGDQKIEACVGDVLYAPAHVPHKFHNLGPGRLETTDLHMSDRFVQVGVPDPEVDNTSGQ